MSVKANVLMKSNVDALLKGRHQTREDLSRWCRREISWASKILGSPTRWFPMKYWDRISDFFGVATYQLLQPGISALTERRRSDRRSGRDRRLRNVALTMHDRLPLARAIADDVFRLEPDDLQVMARTLAELKHRGIDVPSAGGSRSAQGSDADSSAPVHGDRKRKKH